MEQDQNIEEQPDPTTVPDTLDGADLSQIQAFVFRGWSRKFPWSSFLFVQLSTDTEKARAWLRAVREDIAWYGRQREVLNVDGRDMPARLQLALTTKGLRRLGLPDKIVQRFPFEAKAGMERRARVLGDEIHDPHASDPLETLDQFERNKPQPDDWDPGKGGIKLMDADAVLLLFAGSRDDRRILDEAQRKLLRAHGGDPITSEYSAMWREREPFGYADGVSQPVIRGQPEKNAVAAGPKNTVSPGEFLLGYRNEYNQVPKSPRFDKTDGGFDVGKNGSFLVFRKLEQNVVHFWRTYAALGKRFAGQKTGDGYGVPPDPFDATHWVAARAMGRWTNGNSTISCPFAPGTRLPNDKINDFTYGDDPHGLVCPIGSHVRRANPRDQRGGPEDESWKVVKRHRVLRRGRTYGVMFDSDKLLRKILLEDGATDAEVAAHAALHDGTEPPTAEDMATAKSGLLFVCLQANITHGFEFVQQIWNNNPGFHGVFQEPDVIAGPGGSRFSIPARPVRLRLENPFPDPEVKDEDDRMGMPRFVTSRGGGYFFVPSRATVDLLVDGRPPT